MTKLERLNNKLDIERSKYLNTIGAIEVEIINLTGNHEIVSTDFPGDGLGIGLSSDDSYTHASIKTLIGILDNKGSLSIDDILDNTAL